MVACSGFIQADKPLTKEPWLICDRAALTAVRLTPTSRLELPYKHGDMSKGYDAERGHMIGTGVTFDSSMCKIEMRDK